MRFIMATIVILFALPQWASAHGHQSTIPAAPCGGRVCGPAIDVVCHSHGGIATVVVPWSRSDLPSTVMAGTLTRLTFSSGPYRSSLYGTPHVRTRRAKAEAVFDLDVSASHVLVSLLHTSNDVRVSGDYGSYRVVRPKSGSLPCQL